MSITPSPFRLKTKQNMSLINPAFRMLVFYDNGGSFDQGSFFNVCNHPNSFEFDLGRKAYVTKGRISIFIYLTRSVFLSLLARSWISP